MTDPTNPGYYLIAGEEFEAIKVMEALDPLGTVAHCRMTALKYLFRVGSKDGADPELDFDKAAWYCKKASEILVRYTAKHRKL